MLTSTPRRLFLAAATTGFAGDRAGSAPPIAWPAGVTGGAPSAAGAGWLTSMRDWHARGALAFYCAAIPAGVLLEREAPGAMLAVSVGIAALGVPHGALDHWTARRAFGRGLRPSIWWAVFLASYLAAAGAVLGAWFVSPVGSLCGFLLVSAYHFGEEEWALDGDPRAARLQRWAGILARGALPIVLPAFFRPDETATIFAWLTGEPSASAALVDILRWPLGLAWAFALVVDLDRRVREPGSARTIALLILSGLAFGLLPPVLAFALYFTLLHAPRHVLGLLDEAAWPDASRALSRLAASAVPLTVGVFCLAASATCLLMAAPSARLDTSLVRVLFWGLSALTVPHMLLDILAQARSD